MFTEVTGNILTAQQGVIFQGVNCQGVMGSGLALQIRTRYPKVFKDYTSHLARKHAQNADPLGSVCVSLLEQTDSHILCVANCFTQRHYGRNSEICYLDYGALEKSIREVYVRFDVFEPGIRFHIPRIGCGLANGDYTRVRQLLVGIASEYPGIYTLHYT